MHALCALCSYMDCTVLYWKTDSQRLNQYCAMLPHCYFFTSLFGLHFSVFCPTLLHLTPLRFDFVGGYWDWFQDCCNDCIGSSDALTPLLDVFNINSAVECLFSHIHVEGFVTLVACNWVTEQMPLWKGKKTERVKVLWKPDRSTGCTFNLVFDNHRYFQNQPVPKVIFYCVHTVHCIDF